MQSKGNAPSAAQKRWREAVRGLGSVISGEPAVIHHAVGVTGKHNKIAIGHWWILPLTDDEHKSLHAGEAFGCGNRKRFEKIQFERIIRTICVVPIPPHDVCKAISGYHR